MKRKKTTIAIAVLLALIVLPPWLGDGERTTIDHAVRAGAAGSFARLPGGFTHYELAGPARGPVVVLVHGLSTPYYVWDEIVGPLQAAGFRTLRLDLYGRGLSDRPDVAYDVATYDAQLVGLLDHLQINAPVRVVGLSMGGLITANFALKHPERTKRFALIAPFGFPQDTGTAAALVRAPVFGPWLMASAGEPLLRNSQKRTVQHPERHAAFLAKSGEHMQYRGFKRALLRTLRTVVAGDFSQVYVALGRTKPRALLIWGEKDAIVPFAKSELVRRAIPGIQFHSLPDTGHMPPVERPRETVRLLVNFLK